MTDSFDLDTEMERAGLSQADIIRMAGGSRSSFFRWKKDVPIYVVTIIVQQIRIKTLLARLAEASPPEPAGPHAEHIPP